MIAVRSHHGPSITREGQKTSPEPTNLYVVCVAEPEVGKLQAICLPASLPTADRNWWRFCGQICNLFSQSQASPRKKRWKNGVKSLTRKVWRSLRSHITSFQNGTGPEKPIPIQQRQVSNIAYLPMKWQSCWMNLFMPMLQKTSEQ